MISSEYWRLWKNTAEFQLIQQFWLQLDIAKQKYIIKNCRRAGLRRRVRRSETGDFVVIIIVGLVQAVTIVLGIWLTFDCCSHSSSPLYTWCGFFPKWIASKSEICLEDWPVEEGKCFSEFYIRLSHSSEVRICLPFSAPTLQRGSPGYARFSSYPVLYAKMMMALASTEEINQYSWNSPVSGYLN